MGQPGSRSRPRNIRRDGWTAERQRRFLAMLSQTKCVTKAARAVGLSRESAYRFRSRGPHGLFAAAWNRALKFEPTPVKVHKHGVAGISERRRRTLLNRYFPRKSGKGHEVSESDYPPIPHGPRWSRQ